MQGGREAGGRGAVGKRCRKKETQKGREGGEIKSGVRKRGRRI
jgi:hypothetical protein